MQNYETIECKCGQQARNRRLWSRLLYRLSVLWSRDIYVHHKRGCGKKVQRGGKYGWYCQ